MVIGAMIVDAGESLFRVLAAFATIFGYAGLGLYEAKLIRQRSLRGDDE